MLNLNQSNKFKKDYKLCKKRGYHMDLLQSVINTLRIPEPINAKNKDHSLSGNFVGKRECHISPDWLLIYQIIGNELYLVRTGTHSDLLNM